jgi:hypothetical protein
VAMSCMAITQCKALTGLILSRPRHCSEYHVSLTHDTGVIRSKLRVAAMTKCASGEDKRDRTRIKCLGIKKDMEARKCRSCPSTCRPRR